MRILRVLARIVYSLATRIIVITEGYRRTLIKLGIPATKIDVIHCWTADGLFDVKQTDVKLSDELRLAGQLNIVYAGTMGPCQHLQTLVEAAAELTDIPNLQFLLLGDGLDREALEARVRLDRISNVRFLGFRSPEEAAQVFSMADLLVAHLQPTPMSQVSIPSKTFSYMSTGRPILMAVTGESSDLIRRHHCGITVKPCDPSGMAHAIRTFLSLPGNDRQAMGTRARAAYLENYSSQVQVPKVVRALQLARREYLGSKRSRCSDVDVIGSGGHCKVVISTLRAAGHAVSRVYDDTVRDGSVMGVAIQNSDALEHDAEPRSAIIAIGNSADRRSVARRFGFGWISVSHPSAFVDPTATVGEGSVICAGAIVQADAAVGKHVIINTGASIDHDCKIGDFVHIGPGVRLAGNVRIGEGCFLGTGCVVIPGITIGAGTTIGAGAVVVRDIGPGLVAVGCPARPTRPARDQRRAA
jgi:sugar O-acyltransferase (sialic acid O-acetyltransferase NeuD family)